MKVASLSLEIDPVLMEECVLRAVDGRPPAERALFHADRDQIYAVPDPEARERAFGRLHAEWFAQLRLEAPLLRLIGEKPALQGLDGRFVVARARGRNEEGADLHVTRREDGRVVLIRLLPATLLDTRRLEPLLRHELEHVSDMVDPAFGYSPDPPPAAGGTPLIDRLLRVRYHAVWDVSIDGRLAARGQLPSDAAEFRRERFAAAFPMLGEALDSTFRRVFRHPAPTHAWLLALARHADPK